MDPLTDGPSVASELFNRLGYRMVARDLDPQIVGLAKPGFLAEDGWRPQVSEA